MAESRPLGMLDGSPVAHYMRNRCWARCGAWSDHFGDIASLPAGARMCKRCTRLDGLHLECGCDITSASLHRDGVTAFCHRCELDVKLIREGA